MTVKNNRHTILSDNNFMRRRVNSELSEVRKRLARSREAALLEESISQQLERIERAYMQIGQAYMQKHPKDYDEDYLPYVREILDAKEFIDAFNEKLRKIKGLRICPNCGQEIVIDAKFCNYCGQKLEPKKEEKPSESRSKKPVHDRVRICPQCLEIISMDETICPHCKTDLIKFFQDNSESSALNTEAEGKNDSSSETEE